MKKNVFLVGDTSLRSNWGCRATSHFLKELITTKANISKSLDLQDWEFALGVSSRPRTLDEHSAPRLYRSPIQRIRQHLQMRSAHISSALALGGEHCVPETIDKFESLAKALDRRKTAPIKSYIQNADVVIINGEGSFLDFLRPGRIKLFLAYYIKTRFQKPVALVNHSADVTHPALHAMAQLVYPMFDDVIFREACSFNVTSQLRQGLPSLLAGDALFTAPTVERNAWLQLASRRGYYTSFPNSMLDFDPSRGYLCVGGSARFRFQRKQRFDPRHTYVNLINRLSQFGQVVLVGAEMADEDFLLPIAKQLSIPYLGATTPTPQAIDVLSNSLLYVGGRWHTAIKAALGGAPTLMLRSNTIYKSQGFLDLFELKQRDIDCFHIDEELDYLTQHAAHLIGLGAALRQPILQKSQELKETAKQNVRILN